MTDTNTAKDPRCPYCGRPVLGTFVPGAEGRYHLACVEPPAVTTQRIGEVSQTEQIRVGPPPFQAICPRCGQIGPHGCGGTLTRVEWHNQ